MKRFLLVLLILSGCAALHAENTDEQPLSVSAQAASQDSNPADLQASLPADYLNQNATPNPDGLDDDIAYLHHSYKTAITGVPFILGGMFCRDLDARYRSIRNDNIPTFKQWYDNYTQWVPLAAMLGMKIGGIKSQSKWNRMITADVLSGVSMALVVNSIKYTAKQMRPDGSTRNSFPSGHTATAFMCASFMAKEYGYISPWISVGSYTFAGLTGVTRSWNNRHWISDIFAGAGIGIVTTELGYYLAEQIFGRKGLNNIEYTSHTFDRWRRPSYVGVGFGTNVPTGGSNEFGDVDVTIGGGNWVFPVKSTAGCVYNIDGAYFFNPYFGIGGKLTSSNVQLATEEIDPMGWNGIDIVDEPFDESWNVISGSLGVHLSYPVSTRFLIGAKAMMGYSWSKDLKFQLYIPTKEEMDEYIPGTIQTFREIYKEYQPAQYEQWRVNVEELGAQTGDVDAQVDGSKGVIYNTGLNLTYRAAEKMNFTLFGEYNMMPKGSSLSKKAMNTLAFGVGVQVVL